MAGALRRAAGDRALPQPCGGPVRPTAPHPLRGPGHVRRVRRVVGDVDAWRPATGTEIRARFLVAATGVLSVPYFPDVPGREDFRGESYHTGLWPADAGRLRRQAGRGHRHRFERRADHPGHRRRGRLADGLPTLRQLVHAAQQRTDHARRAGAARGGLRSDVRHPATRRPAGSSTRPTIAPPSTTPRRSARRSSRRCGAAPASRSSPATTPTCCSTTAANAEWCEFIAEKIRSIVEDPETAEQADPQGPPLRREAAALRDPATTRCTTDPNVDLVDLRQTPIVRMTERGIETSDGERGVRHRRVGHRVRLRHRRAGADGHPRPGRPGARRTHWADGPRTFLGIQTAGFPNFFFPGGPHAAAGNNPRYNGDQVDFITDTLCHVRAHGYDTIEVDPAAEEKWTNMVDRWATKAPPSARAATTSAPTSPGKPRKYLLNSAGRPKLFAEIDKVSEERLQGVPAVAFGGPGAHGGVTARAAPAVRRSRPASAASPRLRAAAAAVP